MALMKTVNDRDRAYFFDDLGKQVTFCRVPSTERRERVLEFDEERRGGSYSALFG